MRPGPAPTDQILGVAPMGEGSAKALDAVVQGRGVQVREILRDS